MGAYLSCFDVVRPLEKMPVNRGLPTALRMRFCSGHLFSPFGASSDVLKGCLVVQGATRWCVHFRKKSDDQYPEQPAFRIEIAASSDIFHLPFPPRSHRCKAWKVWWHRGRGRVLRVGVMDLYGGLQCAQFWPLPLYVCGLSHGTWCRFGTRLRVRPAQLIKAIF